MKRLVATLTVALMIVAFMWTAASAGEATVTADCEGFTAYASQQDGWVETINGIETNELRIEDTTSDSMTFLIVWTRIRDGHVAIPSGEYTAVRGEECNTTTTTQPPTTTTEPTTTTTQPPPTTTEPPTTSSSTSVPPSTTSPTLPFTGIETGTTAGIATALLGLGSLTVLAVRSRTDGW